MRRRNQQFSCSLLALEAILQREMRNHAFFVHISDKRGVVVGHYPFQNALALYIIGQSFVVLVCTRVHIETTTFCVVRWVKICKYASALRSTGEVLDEESVRIHVGNVNTLTFICNCKDAICKVFPVKTSVYLPLAFLLVTTDGSSAEQNTGSITAVQIERGKAKRKCIAGVSTQIDISLFSPFRNVYRNRQNVIRESLRLMKCSIPESGDMRIKVVQVDFRDNTLLKKTQRSTCASSKWLKVCTAREAVGLDCLSEENRQRRFSAWISQRAVKFHVRWLRNGPRNQRRSLEAGLPWIMPLFSSNSIPPVVYVVHVRLSRP